MPPTLPRNGQTQRPRGGAIRLLSAVLLWALLAAPAAAADTPPEPPQKTDLEQIQARIQETRSETARALFVVGRVHMREGRFAEAAASFRRVAELDPQFPDIQLSLGTALLRAGEPAQASEALQQALERSPESLDARMLLALARIELGELEAATADLEHVAQQEGPLRSLALVHLGRVRELQGDPEGARSALRDAIDAEPDGASAGHARSLLNRLDRTATRSRPYRLSVSVAGLFDDNVVTPEIDSSTGATDGAAEFELSGAYRPFDAFLSARGYEASIGYDLFQSVYGEYTDFDLQTHTFSLQGSRKLSRFDLSLGYAYTLATLGGDRLLDSNELTPTVEFLAQPWWYAIAGPRITFKNFDDDDRDGLQVSPGALNFFFLPDQSGYLLLGMRYDYENTDARRYDYHGMRLRLGYHAPVRDWFEFDARYRFRLRDYTGETASIGEERLDKIHTVGVRLSRELGRGFEVRLEYEYENSDSNLPSADYDQNHVRLRFRWKL